MSFLRNGARSARDLSFLAPSTCTPGEREGALQIDEHLVVRRAPRIPFGLMLTLPFCWATWSALAAMLALSVAVRALMLWRRRLRAASALFAAVEILEMVLTGSTSRPLASSAQRLVALCVILLHVLAGNSYTGLLLGFLTVPRHFPDLDSVRDVLRATDRLCVSANYYHDIQQGHLQALNAVKGKITRVRWIHERDECLRDIVDSGRAATCMPENIFNILSRYRKYTHKGERVLHKVKEPLRSANFGAYPVRRNNFIVHVVNMLILRLWQAGLFDQWDRVLVYTLDVDGQYTNHDASDHPEPEKLRLDHLSGPFLLWGAGLCLAAVAFLFQHLQARAWGHVARRSRSLVIGWINDLLTTAIRKFTTIYRRRAQTTN